MRNEREFLLNELQEHTEDCDCARCQHFYDERVFRTIGKFFNAIQSLVFLITIATYILVVSGVQQGAILNGLGILLAVISTLLVILSYMFRFDEKAMSHWKAAQIYSELYRKCQFFCSHYSNASLDVWREKLIEISEELSRVSLLSPSVSQRSYIEWSQYGCKKQYPVHRAIYDLKTEDIQNVISTIIKEFRNSKIEIFLFGSFLTNMHYNDIDIAVILHENEKNLNLKEKMNNIERQYIVKGLNLDITIISEADIIANRCTTFLKNICAGRCYYKSPEVKKSIREYIPTLSNYSEMIVYFEEQAEKTKDNYILFVSNVFYMYYHALTALLNFFEIAWYGEDSLLTECDMIMIDEDKMKQLGISSDNFSIFLSHVRLFKDEKNIVYLNTLYDESEFSIIKEYFNSDKIIVKQILNKVSNYSK